LAPAGESSFPLREKEERGPTENRNPSLYQEVKKSERAWTEEERVGGSINRKSGETGGGKEETGEYFRSKRPKERRYRSPVESLKFPS